MSFESIDDLKRDLLETLPQNIVTQIIDTINDGKISQFENGIYAKIMNTISTDQDWLNTKQSTDPTYTSDDEILDDIIILCELEKNGVSSNDLLNRIQEIPELDNNCYFLIESTLKIWFF